MMKFGWKAGPEQFPPTELTGYAIDAEKAGFDVIDTSDHFNPWSEEGQAGFTWTWLFKRVKSTWEPALHVQSYATTRLSSPRQPPQFHVTHQTEHILESEQVRH